tara:strand:- start:21250 stop:22029 length:780 start_codon:yes stop_codon:yes gene_type:complete
MITTKHITFWCLAALMPVSQLSAQMGGGDPSKEIKEIAAAIDRQLKEIDDLLRESGRSGQKRNKPKELLEKAAESSDTVQDGIEKLIEKLNDMKNQGGQGQPSDDQKSQSNKPQDGQPQQGQPQQGSGDQQRRENENPEFVQQPQEGQEPGQEGQPKGQEGQKPGEKPGDKPGEKPQEQPGDGQPKGGKESKDGGQNRVGNKPPNSPTGPGQPGTGEGEWGGLQPYLNFLRNRGSSPKVPEKYRKYYEAYLKNKAKGKK